MTAETPPPHLRVAVVGVGSIGRRHLETLVALGVTDVVAVSQHLDGGALRIGDLDVPVRGGLTDALDDVDVVIIASPTSHHADQLAATVAAGRHVLVEKPVADRTDAVRAIAQQAVEVGVVASVGHQFRFEPGLVELRRLVGAGDLGTIVSVHAVQGEHLADFHPDEDYRVGYAARRDLGGGVLRTQIHHIDYLDWIFGPLHAVTAVGGRLSRLEIDVEDSASYLFSTPDGTAVLGHVDYLQRPKSISMQVIGTDGRADWDHYGGRLTVHAPDGSSRESSWPYDRQAMFEAQMRDFLDAVRTGGTTRTPLSDGIRAMELVEAIESSMASGHTVPVSQGTMGR